MELQRAIDIWSKIYCKNDFVQIVFRCIAQCTDVVLACQHGGKGHFLEQCVRVTFCQQCRLLNSAALENSTSSYYQQVDSVQLYKWKISVLVCCKYVFEQFHWQLLPLEWFLQMAGAWSLHLAPLSNVCALMIIALQSVDTVFISAVRHISFKTEKWCLPARLQIDQNRR